MTSSPRGIRMQAGDGDSPNSPRLTLHIPNSYPRSISPRSSPILGQSPASKSINIPIEEGEEERGRELERRDISPIVSNSPLNDTVTASQSTRQIKPTNGGIQRRGYGSIAANNQDGLLPSASVHHERQMITSVNRWDHVVSFFVAHNTTGESARDFLARERTFFSWLRLSTTLAIGSAALFLRLQLRDLNQVNVQRTLQRTLQGKAIRKYLQHQTEQQQQQQQIPHSFLMTASKEQNLLDTSVALSKALGILFFILALFSLCVGWIDYIRCVRALEHADETVPIFPPPSHAQQEANDQSAISTNDDDHPRNMERRAVAQKWHDARHARQAHSTRIVYITEVVVAVVIFGTALTILLTNNKASIAPIPPNETDSLS